MRLLKENAIAVGIDIQERLFSVMQNNNNLEQKAVTLLKGLQVLAAPVVFTEQYPKGLGATINSIKELLDTDQIIEKASFSCCDEPSFIQRLQEYGKKSIILFGIETHVCVMQTAVDLLAEGYAVYLVVDAVSSRNENDKNTALKRMEQEGVFLCTVESVLFELCRSSASVEFKAISGLVK